MADQETENKSENEIQERFNFKPGSSQTALQKYHAAQRKKIDVTPSPPASPPQIGDWRITLADKATKERCSRRIQVCGHNRNTPSINLPEAWILWWYSNYKDKKDVVPLVDLEFSADKSTITIRKRPPAKGMEKSIYDDDNNLRTEVFAADSDEYARKLEDEQQEQKETNHS